MSFNRSASFIHRPRAAGGGGVAFAERASGRALGGQWLLRIEDRFDFRSGLSLPSSGTALLIVQ